MKQIKHRHIDAVEKIFDFSCKDLKNTRRYCIAEIIYLGMVENEMLCKTVDCDFSMVFKSP